MYSTIIIERITKEGGKMEKDKGRERAERFTKLNSRA